MDNLPTYFNRDFKLLNKKWINIDFIFAIHTFIIILKSNIRVNWSFIYNLNSQFDQFEEFILINKLEKNENKFDFAYVNSWLDGLFIYNIALIHSYVILGIYLDYSVDFNFADYHIHLK